MLKSRPMRILQLTGAALLTTALVACGNTEEPAPAPQTTPAESSAGEEPEETSETSTSSETSSSTTSTEETSESDTPSETEDSEEPSETTSASAGAFSDDVDAAYEIFGSIAPRELFEKFDSCDPVGNDDNYNCSGPEVGQLQFSKSSSRASQTTQVLTELRSSTVLEDSGDRVVGWSTLGSTAVLTVVDNDEGLVVQQMLSTDQEDPEDRLIELGLYTP